MELEGLQALKGLGSARIKRLNEAGIFTPLDLCFHFPHRYIDASTVNIFEFDCESVGFGSVVKAEKKFVRKNLSYVKAEFECGEITFFATWFNQPYVSQQLKVGKEFFVIGKATERGGKIEITAPTLRAADKGGGIIPVYRGTGLGSVLFSSIVRQVLESTKISSFLPAQTRQEFGILDTQAAFWAAHFPADLKDAKKARESLSLENLAGHIALFNHAKAQNLGEKPQKYGAEQSEKITLDLPFELTNDQKSAYSEIVTALKQSTPANILVQGDVGSGKTAVCLAAMDFAAKNHHQSVLLCPTELLARQHFTTASSLFVPQMLEFLSGSQTAAERKNSAKNIASGQAKIIIGTHSVFNKDIKYQDLSLVVTDEQHRFGVGQRGALENKGFAPDRIVMSATPIPRTLALTLYGDLQLISIKNRPAKKAQVNTRFVTQKTAEMYKYIVEKAQKGEQTFVICPRIEGDDEGLTGAVELFKQLKTKLNTEIGLLHGRLKDAEKTAAMADFAQGKTKILVATTIVEVGIDVPAATTMVVYNAERYGLSQLHQLRGRIGRGGKDGYCFLLCSNHNSQQRLEILEQTDDGFLLAEKDFEQRGAGDFLGTRQHGASLSLTGEPVTLALLQKAKTIANQLENHDLDAVFSQKSILSLKEIALN